MDRAGRSLPLDPVRVNVDLPIVSGRDVVLLDLLYNVRVRTPAFFDRISEVRRSADGELAVRLTDEITVRAMADVTIDRFEDLALVEQDLARRKVKVRELDVRFRDQVVARLP